MQIRKFEMDKDYDDLASWWQAWKFTPLPPAFLSTNGFVAEMDGRKIGVVFVYMSDSAICWLEWLTTNPQANREERTAALDMLVQAVVSYAKDNHYLGIFTSTIHPSLKRLYPKHGFIAAETNVSHYLWLKGLDDGGS